MNKYICPVCGCGMQVPPVNYNICASCGTEFGLHDENASLEELRASWIMTGPRWWSKTEPQPDNWNPFIQLANPGVTVAASIVSTTASFTSPNTAWNPLLLSGTEFDVNPALDYFDWAGRYWGRSSGDMPHASQSR
jgi:hypothetical protein